MRFVVAIAFVLLAGCGHDSTRPVVSSVSPITVSPDSTWRVLGGLVDEVTHEPLIGANVIIQYRQSGNDSIRIAGVATDVDGEFRIIIRSHPAPELLRLETTYPGFKPASLIMPQYDSSSLLNTGVLKLRRDTLRRDELQKKFLDVH